MKKMRILYSIPNFGSDRVDYLLIDLSGAFNCNYIYRDTYDVQYLSWSLLIKG